MKKFDINLNLYRSFYYVAKFGGFTVASKKMMVSQPALSANIKNLEDILGVQLIDRKIGKIALTNNGRELFLKLEEIINILNGVIEQQEINIGCIRVIADITQELDDIDNPVAKLKIKKALLSTILPDETVLEVLQDEIERLEAEQEEGKLEEESADDEDINVSIDSGPVFHRGDSEEEPDEEEPDEEAPSEAEEEPEEGSVILPSPADLDIDMTEM